jgi:hypothetical protein
LSQHIEELNTDSIGDIELLLLSWAQLTAVELIVDDEETRAGKMEIVERLHSAYGVTDIVLKNRTFEHYVITYRERNKEREVKFAIDEVESIYDL